jgi:predicted GNAT family acetyltransferase
MNGEVLAAITMSFPGETPTISPISVAPEQSSCLTSIRRWMTQKANYIPTNMEECYIEMIGVKSAYRNHGIGAAMLECVEHFARQAGAVLLTIHISGDQLRNYFQRFGFLIDNTDNSAFWKWIVERQSTQKMTKPISPSDENTDYPMDNTSSYINESMVGSQDE